MTDVPISDAEHREALRALAAEFAKHGIRIMALGSSAVLLKSGMAGGTKDIDVHPFPVGDFEKYWDAIELVAKNLGGTVKIEPDGASITMHIRIRDRMVPVELIEGREDFIEPHVLDDAKKSAQDVNGILVPSWEHVAVMKAEAWYDRTGETRAKYREDMVKLASRFAEDGTRLDAAELERLVKLRPERKHEEMLSTIFRVLDRVLQ